MRLAMPISWRSSRRCACVLSLCDDAVPRVQHESSCEHESRGSVCGSCCVADTYASRLLSSVCGGESILNCYGGVKLDFCVQIRGGFSSRDGVNSRLGGS